MMIREDRGCVEDQPQHSRRAKIKEGIWAVLRLFNEQLVEINRESGQGHAGQASTWSERFVLGK